MRPGWAPLIASLVALLVAPPVAPLGAPFVALLGATFVAPLGAKLAAALGAPIIAPLGDPLGALLRTTLWITIFSATRNIIFACFQTLDNYVVTFQVINYYKPKVTS